MLPDIVTDKLRKLPELPGVYQFFDSHNTLLYVGKAKVLKNRVKSYFIEQKDRSPRTQKMIEHIADLRWIETSSEVEALALETNLIKEHQPKYNVLLRDDKNFVYVKITHERCPRLEIVRKVLKDGARYFGPKTDSRAAREGIKILEKLFFVRVCQAHPEEDPQVAAENRKKYILPCPYFQIGMHGGPHMDDITEANYAAWVAESAAFLSGTTGAATDSLTTAMQAAAEARNFEYAARLRDQLQAIQALGQHQRVSDPSLTSRDILGIIQDGAKAYVALLEVRDGKLIDQKNMTLSCEGATLPKVLSQLIRQLYTAVPNLPSEIVIPEEADDHALLEEWLTTLNNKKVALIVPQRGVKEGLLNLAEKNAAAYRVQSRAAFENASARTVGAAEELARTLSIDKKLTRIECYDISHLGGEATSSTMVVFIHGEPAPTLYRSFRIRTLQSGDIDDYASLTEVLRRRMSYLVPQVPEDIRIRRATKKERAIIKSYREEKNCMDYWGTGPVYVAARGTELLGFACEDIEPQEKKHIVQTVYIAPEARGHHLGQEIIKYLMSKSKAKKWYLDCKPSLENYYGELGFRTIDWSNFPEYMEGAAPDQLLMMRARATATPDPSFTSTPDLIIVDGGKGQLSTVLSNVRFSKKTTVIGLAKREETLVQLANPEDEKQHWHYIEKNLPNNSDALHLVQRIRNEAHRCANDLRKSILKKSDTASSLDEIPGIGITTRRLLMQHYGSIPALIAADPAELRALVGNKKAKAIQDALGGEMGGQTKSPNPLFQRGHNPDSKQSSFI